MKEAKSKIAILLPALNEEGAIGKVIDEIRELPFKCNIIVVDGQSDDKTVRISIEKSVEVIQTTKGKGKQILYALRFLTTRDRGMDDYIFMLDSDYTYPAKFIEPMLSYLEMGYDAVVGWRRYKNKGSMSSLHDLGNRCLTLWAGFLWNFNGKYTITNDLCSGMWGFTGSTARHLSKVISSDGFTLEADIFASLVKGKYKIAEIPIEYRARVGSKPKLRLLDGFKIAWFLFKKRIGG